MSSKDTADTGTSASAQNYNVNAEQLATFSEGKVADAVQRKPGAQKASSGEEPVIDDFASDLDKKKAEQAEARAAVKEGRQEGANIDGSLGEGRLGVEDNRDV